jgi:hypothetical protein
VRFVDKMLDGQQRLNSTPKALPSIEPSFHQKLQRIGAVHIECKIQFQGGDATKQFVPEGIAAGSLAREPSDEEFSLPAALVETLKESCFLLELIDKRGEGCAQFIFALWLSEHQNDWLRLSILIGSTAAFALRTLSGSSSSDAEMSSGSKLR